MLKHGLAIADQSLDLLVDVAHEQFDRGAGFQSAVDQCLDHTAGNPPQAAGGISLRGILQLAQYGGEFFQAADGIPIAVPAEQGDLE